ncbi:dapper homolog 3-like [Plectropomus leopardus]|uniref:dapper homolog 3-like n=1 Tax=Plectropomus leopardus TaxID=160734 RepID=UPI001C4B25B1|nr:dapper homolog 3-like [Plectropomus leopardus]
MSLQKLPGSFGVMFPAFSLPMKAERSRNKERLEASLAGLCELELLKQRQECRVLSALCLGDSPAPGRPPWGALRSARCALDAPNGDASEDYSFGLQTSSLQCTPWGIKASLEQQVAELKVNTEVQSADSPADLEDSHLTAGEVLAAKKNGSTESNYHPLVPRSFSAPEGTGETETGETWLSDPARCTTATDALGEMKDVDPSQEDHKQAQKVETYIVGLIQRRALPTRPSKPRTSLSHDARAVSVVRQSSLCRKEEHQLPKQVSIQEISTPSQCSEGTAPQACHNLDQEPYLGSGFTEEIPPPYVHNLQQSIQHQQGLYHRPRQAAMINNSRSTLLDYPPCRVLQVQPDSSNSEPDSPQHFHNYPSPPASSKPHQPFSPDEQLVNAEYIPAQPCRASTRAYAHPHSNPNKGSGAPKPNRSTYSPERGHHHHHHHHHQEQQPTASQIQSSKSRGGPKKCRSSEDRNGASRKPGKKACRSQSENSLQRAPERKYNTVERDGGGSGSGGRGSRSSQSKSKKQQQGSGSCRRWQSTQELSQDEADQPPMQAPMQGSSASNQRDHCSRRTRKPRPTHVSYAYPHHHHSHHHQHMEYQLERDQVPLCQPGEDYPHPRQGESESSMSEADSPDSSSLSSDSDESGGLVWPQQLPPQLALPSPPAPPGAPLQPKAFVKIKASHALKKKILRFRTGSLKVMTTV